MFAISLGINERKKMFILVVVGVIDSNFDVSEKYSVVGLLPDLLPGLFLSVTRRFLQGTEEATIENGVGEDSVGDEHFKIIITF